MPLQRGFVLLEKLPQTHVGVSADAGGGPGMVQGADNGLLHGFHRGFKDPVDVLIIEHFDVQNALLAVMRQVVCGGKGDGDVAAAVSAVGTHPPQSDHGTFCHPLELPLIERDVRGQDDDDKRCGRQKS